MQIRFVLPPSSLSGSRSQASRITLVTGANRGIGLEACGQLRRLGFSVLLGSRDPDRGAAPAGQVGATAVALGAADPAEPARLTEQSGQVDFLINNAEIIMTPTRLRLGPIGPSCARHSKDGSITLSTAASSRLANPGTSGLAAINGAMERMVPALARELAPLRVNAVFPGAIDTAWWSDKPAALFEAESRNAPLARAGQAD